jgi:short-subunit dehydrogenase
MERDLFHQEMPEYKKAIIIGASSGIGRELARILTKNKYIVGITGRREHLLRELQNENPGQYIFKAFDIRDLSKTAKNLGELIKELGGLDLFVISSGIGYINPELDAEPEFQTIDTNITAFTDLVTFAFRYFRNHKGGHLVGITSIGALRGNKSAPAYNASKAYQSNYLEGLRQKAKSSEIPIFVTDIKPGFVATDMAKGDRLFWVASPEKAAQQIYRAIRHKKRKAYITKRWRLFAVLLKIFPGWLYEKL